ncbi:MAG: hypothetical protein KIG95_03870 [Comamonas sp.]|nr:hypothetical protein [Comamonas sp.]
MKITKRNPLPEERLWRGQCATCGSQAEAMQREMTNITHDQRHGSFSWEACPVCRAGEVNAWTSSGMCFYPHER